MPASPAPGVRRKPRQQSRPSRKRQRSGNDMVSGSEQASEATQGLEVAVGKALKKGSGAADLKNNRFAALPITTPAPATATPAPITPPEMILIGPPKTPLAPKSKSLQEKRDVVLAPPQSAFTFTCARPASMTMLPRTVATRNLASLNAAARITPQTAKPPLSLFTKAELGGSQPEKVVEGDIIIPPAVVFDTVHPEIAPSIKPATPLLPSTKPPLSLDTAILTPPTTPPVAIVSSKRIGETLSQIPVPKAPQSEATGWLEAAQRAMGTATRDGKSRFFPTLSTRKSADGSKPPPAIFPVPFSPPVAQVALPPPTLLKSPEPEYPHGKVAAQGCYAPKGRDLDEGYESQSASESGYESPLVQVGFSMVGSPTLSVSPSSEGWEGWDEGFWV
ncbi:hypothetical protein MMC30_000528 [Trapelia coarctata]|nr:hypothetical protein [Trapelia coarctata]